MPKCRYCGKNLSDEEAVVVERLGKNDYYCPEHKGLRTPLEKAFQLVKWIIGEPRLSLDDRKLLKYGLESVGVSKAYSYLCHSSPYWKQKYEVKDAAGDFRNANAKIKYLLASLQKILPNYSPPKAREVKPIDCEPMESNVSYKKESNSQKLDRLLAKSK